MKKTYIVLASLICLLAGMIFMNFIHPSIEANTKRRDINTENIVYSESYTENLREETIRELYGDRNQYATEHTGSRADYVDKEASMGGELVIDEERMQAVYESKLLEFDAMVDMDRVNAIVKDKQEQLIEREAFKDVNKKTPVYSRETMYWISGGKYLGMAALVLMILYIIFFKILKKNKK